MSSSAVESIEQAAERKSREEAREMFLTTFQPTSKIPWIKYEKKCACALKFDDSNFANMMHKFHEKEFGQLIRLVNEIAPFYHPQRSVSLIFHLR